ncbi:MAG TPA: immunoglobulin domain-containing protein [Opitutaceae bacterium]|nr:immunoglobulin domain-containing protein [Opitutaceae bacterium]
MAVCLPSTAPFASAQAPIPPTIISQPGDVASAVDGTGYFSVQADGTPAPTFQWRKDGVDIAGAVQSTLNLYNIQLSDAGTYTVAISNVAGTVISNPATLTVYMTPEVSQEPQSVAISIGKTASFTVTASGNEPLYYQWYFTSAGAGTSHGQSSGWDQPTLTISDVQPGDAGTYQCLAYYSNYVSAVWSAVASLTIAPEITTITPQSQTIGNGAFTLTVNGTGFLRSSGTGSNSSSLVCWNGAVRPTTFVNNATLTAAIPATDIAGFNGMVTAVITVYNYTTGALSNAKALAVVPAAVVKVQSDVAAVGSSVTVTTAPVVAGDSGVAATLQNNTAGQGDAAITVASYSTNPTPAPSFDLSGGYVGVQATGVDSTDAATVAFYYSSAITGSVENNLTLQYYDGTNWAPVLGSGGVAPAKNTTDNLDGTVSGGRFAVVFDDTSTPQLTELTDTVFAMSVPDDIPPVIQSVTASPYLLAPANHQMVPVTITVVATDNVDPQPKCRIVSVTSNEPISGTGPGDLSPDWAITGDLTLNLRAERASKGDGRVYTITVEAKDASGNASTQTTIVTVPKDSDAGKDRPAITSQPRDQTVQEGTDATFSVTVAPALPVTYQWRFNCGIIPNATAATLTLHNVTWANAGCYSVTVTNSVGATNSKTAELTVIPRAPVITVNPLSQTVNSGSNVTFSVTATSSAPPSYQWRFKGKAICGARSASLTLRQVELSDAGAYSVVVSNDGGSITSAAAILTVNAPVITSLAPATVTAGGNAFTLTVNGTGFVNGAVVKWNGDKRPTKFGDNTALTASISACDIDCAKTVSITVCSPSGDVSNAKTLAITLPPAPTITVAPKSQTVSSGDVVTFGVTATSTVPLSYQWLYKGKAICGAKSASLTLTKVELSDAGAYSVIVSNNGGAVTSAAATLTVLAPTIASINPNTVNAGSGAFTLKVTGANFVNGAVVNWNGDDCPTAFANSTTLTASIPAKDIPAKQKNGKAQTVQITVKSPSGDCSNAQVLTIAP